MGIFQRTSEFTKKRPYLGHLLFIGTMVLCQPAYAGDVRSAAQQVAEDLISSLVEIPASGKLEVAAMPLDSRLRLQPCQQALRAETIGKGHIRSHTTVRVVCDDPTPWDIYVSVRVKVLRPIVVAGYNLSSGTVMDKRMLRVVMKDTKLVHGQTFSEISPLLKSKVKRTVQAGQPITARNICFVCKGEPVTIVASSNNIKLKTAGTAMRDGNSGDTVSVRNNRSRRMVEARVVSVGLVEVIF